MKQVLIIIMAVIGLHTARAQQEKTLLRNGNKLYRQQQFDKSLSVYEQAVQQNPANPVASYNLGDAQFRTRHYAEAEKSFDNAISHAPNNDLKEKAYYNKGVSYSKEKKLPESIATYKEALLLNPADSDARFNLQKALTEMKQQQQQQQPDQQQQKKQQQQQKQQQPQSKLSKQKVEQLLKALQQKEQEVQQKMLQNKTRSASQQEKDW